jgi:hypothetical protein
MRQMRTTLEEQLRAELSAQLEAQRQSSWRDMFCCCLPRKQVGGQGTAAATCWAACAAGQAWQQPASCASQHPQSIGPCGAAAAAILTAVLLGLPQVKIRTAADPTGHDDGKGLLAAAAMGDAQ